MFAACGAAEQKAPETQNTSGTEQTAPEGTQTDDKDLDTILDEQKDTLVAAIGAVTDMSVFSTKEGEIYNNNNSGSKAYTLKASRGAATVDSIVVGGYEFADGTNLKVSEFMQKGWSCSQLDHEVSSSFTVMMPCQDSNGKNAIIRGHNASDTAVAFQDCVVTGVDVQYDGLNFDASSAADMQINGTVVTRVDSLTKAIEKVGCPNKIYIEEYFTNGVYGWSRVTLTYDHDGAALVFDYRIENGKSSLQGITYDCG